MANASASPGLERNLRLYPYYQLSLGFWPWIPVFFLYFSQHLSLERVLLLEAIYYAAVVALELPSGYFSDRVGRRATLLISSLSFLLSYALFFTGSTFTIFALAQVLLAAGFAFNSGTDTALHFDSLAALGRPAEYGPREARASRLAFLSGALGAVAGGAAASFALRAAYALSFLSALSVLLIVLAMREPHPPSDSPRPPTPRFLRQLGDCLAQLRRPALAWLFAFAVAMTVLIHIPYEFYQPYLDLLSQSGGQAPWDRALARLPVPLASGLLMAASMLIGSWAAGRSVDIAERHGTAPTLLTGLAFLVLLTGVMSQILAGWVIGLILLRNVARALMTAPLNAAVTPRLPQQPRAPHPSPQSLARPLRLPLTLLSLPPLVAPAAHPTWPALSSLLTASTALGLLLLLGLALSARQAGVDGPIPIDASDR